jgi:Skp family chaperone for outer membrane proteins
MEDLNDELIQAVTAAAKILAGDTGQEVDVPAPQADVQASMKKITKALDDPNKARNDMEDQLPAYENSLDKIRNDLVAFRQKLPKEKFGLDGRRAGR